MGNVSTGKPKIGGAVYRAPLGTTLPTDATTSLNAAFVALGYCSDDGLTNADTPETSNVKAWGGDTVLTMLTSKEDTFSFTLIESLNLDVLKAVYGTANVTGSLSAGVTVKSKSEEPVQACWVIEMILAGGIAKRIVIPCAAISELGEIAYKDDEPIGYEVTLACVPDTNGVNHYEYIKQPSTSA